MGFFDFFTKTDSPYDHMTQDELDQITAENEAYNCQQQENFESWKRTYNEDTLAMAMFQCVQVSAK